MKKHLLPIIFLFFSLYSFAQNDAYIKSFYTIDTASFQNSAHHWYDIFDDENIINAVPNQPRYAATQIKEIADNILLYQKNNGGWPKNYDMRAILTEQEKQKLLAAKTDTNTTFDNSTTHSHVACLARVYYVIKDGRYKDACLKGIDYILASQYENGGWPQFYPLQKNYSREITYNDDVMTGIMNVLKDILDSRPQYSFVDAARKAQAAEAYKRGLDCIFKTQIVVNGSATAWCQQYDEVKLTPAWARKFEPPSICNRESVPVVLFLMSIDNPDERTIHAVQSSVKWFNDSKILGIREKTIAAEPVKFKYRLSKTDKIVIADSTAPPIWARYYEIGSQKPLFCNRDGKPVYTLAEVERERRDGYTWYTYDPQLVLDKYKKWQQKWAPENNVLQKN
ncbi:pectate lyase [Ferruginibacter albus]|uniref:pectate lyase n=1 Tax=Ferruginibacter albus TaxID=2875540 RepID=UPI001CC36107|nr:pectate lyase [Ferruginibacter albus]UAY53389.1 pectate lyase [Ferruginibacter albus]